MDAQQLRERLKQCAYRCIQLCEALPVSTTAAMISKQLIRSSLSAAVNYRSATRAQSKKQFLAKLNIALEEIDESCSWIEAIGDLNLMPVDKISSLHQEATELTKILSATKRTTRMNLIKEASSNTKQSPIANQQSQIS